MSDPATVAYRPKVVSRDADRKLADRRSKQEIGSIPPIEDPDRRRRAIATFSTFAKTYFAAELNKPLAKYHRDMFREVQRAVREGGWHAMALPRGGGKTTICMIALLWSILRGSHSYAVAIAATTPLAERLIDSLKTTLLTNELLLRDFPHAIHPILMLDGEARRANGQLYMGQKTHIQWKQDRIVFPWIPGKDSTCPGAVIESYGITAAFRGLRHLLPNGESIRPSIGLIDDPQTRESAKSATQTQGRLETLTGDIAYLTGPGEPFTCFCTTTVVYEGDLADQLLDRDKNPEWHGTKVKMVESFPTNTQLWDDYQDILREELREGGKGTKATAFYKKHRKEMDAGAKVSWEERKRKDEVSALQHAMNLKYRDELSFQAEMQNEPVTQQSDLELLKADQIARKTTAYQKGQIPEGTTHITAFVDVQDKHFFWMVCAWDIDGVGYVVDYGPWPEQGRVYFHRADVRRTLDGDYSHDDAAKINIGLKDLIDKKLCGPGLDRNNNRHWETMDGREMTTTRICVDANWRQREVPVRAAARQHEMRRNITLTYGKGITAMMLPLTQSSKAKDWNTFQHWYWNDGPGLAKGVTFDANYWKLRVHKALALPAGTPGSISLFKGTELQHRMLSEHLTAELPVLNATPERTVYQWKPIPGRDNEGLDCLVGCALAASIAGFTREVERVRPKKERISLGAMANR